MYAVNESRAKFTAGQAAEAAGVEYHHVNHWAKIGLIRPSVMEATGSHSIRVYSFGDVVALKAVGQLRAAGFGCEALKEVAEALQGRRYASISDSVLIGNADGEVSVVASKKVLGLIQGGSFAWILDLGVIVREVDEAASNRVRATRGRASMIA